MPIEYKGYCFPDLETASVAVLADGSLGGLVIVNIASYPTTYSTLFEYPAEQTGGTGIGTIEKIFPACSPEGPLPWFQGSSQFDEITLEDVPLYGSAIAAMFVAAACIRAIIRSLRNAG